MTDLSWYRLLSGLGNSAILCEKVGYLFVVSRRGVRFLEQSPAFLNGSRAVITLQPGPKLAAPDERLEKSVF